MLPIVLLLFAGLMYDFETVITSPYGSERRHEGTVTVDELRYRVDLGDNVVISTDGDETAGIYDAKRNQWWERKRSAVTRSSLLFGLPQPGGRVGGRPSVRHRREGEAVIEGYAATRHVIELDYTLVGEIMDEKYSGEVHAIARIWAIESLPPLPMKSEVRTGFAQVDALIEKASENVKGMIVRHELEVTRTLEGGQPLSESTKTVATNIRIVDVPEETFEKTRG